MMKAYDRDGNEISIEEWGNLHADRDYVRVGSDYIGPYWVSTVWLGLDHGHIPGAPPVIFETMVFSANDGSEAEEFYSERYRTLLEARSGHGAMCLEVRATWRNPSL